ncbi:MAG: hypothetical protein Q4C85_10335 [Actinomyces sp.]|uniref:hypothetical protein n=1 Tax=Actinomyces sp. TaxID=29317 RepID=UPI0026DAAD35|nr:hypothetical protein [Actinomyces sp.]MDO4244135.1 hypothetical protein [Actinomyces sp.]
MARPHLGEVARAGAPAGHVEQALSRYPRLTTLILDTGGHLMTGHSRQIDDVVTRFVAQHAG